jgi:DNA-binding transcriptional LysR family regulator
VDALRAFVAVARHASVSRAAESLARTQSAISARLTGLERAWSTRLFRRVARGMVLTHEGARLLPLAEGALRDLVGLDRAAGVAGERTDELRVGAGDALGRRLLPRAIAVLLRGRPALEVRVREGPGPALVDALRSGEIDLALLLGPVRSGGAAIDRAPLVESPVDLLVPRARRAPMARATALADLAGQRLVTLQRGSAFRRHLETAFAAAGLPFAPAVEVGNLSLVVQFVGAGLGVAPFPAIALRRADAAGRVERRALAGIEPLRYERAVRTGAPVGAAAARLIEILGRSGGRC